MLDGIPPAAIQMMGQKSIAEVRQSVFDNKGISLLELRTFCWWNGPITETATGDVVGYVGAWSKTTATIFTVRQDDWLVLIGLEEDPQIVAALVENWETVAVELFQKYYNPEDDPNKSEVTPKW